SGCCSPTMAAPAVEAPVVEAPVVEAPVVEAPAETAASSGCCSGGEKKTVSLSLSTAGGCCGGGDTSADSAKALHDELADLFRQYDVNEFAASVRVWALKK